MVRWRGGGIKLFESFSPPLHLLHFSYVTQWAESILVLIRHIILRDGLQKWNTLLFHTTLTYTKKSSFLSKCWNVCECFFQMATLPKGFITQDVCIDYNLEMWHQYIWGATESHSSVIQWHTRYISVQYNCNIIKCILTRNYLHLNFDMF